MRPRRSTHASPAPSGSSARPPSGTILSHAPCCRLLARRRPLRGPGGRGGASAPRCAGVGYACGRKLPRAVASPRIPPARQRRVACPICLGPPAAASPPAPSVSPCCRHPICLRDRARRHHRCPSRSFPLRYAAAVPHLRARHPPASCNRAAARHPPLCCLRPPAAPVAISALATLARC
ncbi:hypothetical protein BS78_09G022900 [Paspalum vaginatum]|nr:hypothetical protein BS78_09G022900 [Paspalum vaginatum]